MHCLKNIYDERYRNKAENTLAYLYGSLVSKKKVLLHLYQYFSLTLQRTFHTLAN